MPLARLDGLNTSPPAQASRLRYSAQTEKPAQQSKTKHPAQQTSRRTNRTACKADAREQETQNPENTSKPAANTSATYAISVLVVFTLVARYRSQFTRRKHSNTLAHQ